MCSSRLPSTRWAAPGISTEQVPAIAFKIKEHGQLSVRLIARRRHESHTRRRHPLVGCIEIIHAEEEAHASGKLLPDDASLMLAICFCEQKSGLPFGRPDDDPAFWATVIRERLGIFNQMELEHVEEEAESEDRKSVV